ncbi:hypothetical protein QQ045_022869 [Rhodiola kirilowii]
MVGVKQLSIFLATAFFISSMWWKVVNSRHLPSSSSMSQRHNKWMAKFGRVYTSESEKRMRLQIFAKNAKYVDEFNAVGDKLYNVSINHFADHTDEEIAQRYYGYNYKASDLLQDPKFETSFRYEHAKNIPESMDWRQKGVLTPIKNQEPLGTKCGTSHALCKTPLALASAMFVFQLKSSPVLLTPH